MAKTKVAIEIKNFGTIKLELYPDKAPLTVENFLKLVNEDFYTGLIFHRVIEGFMIQGGGMDENMNGKRAASIKGEFRANSFAQNDVPHLPGTISMARTADPNSASSQFFIMHEYSPHLDGQYAAFGKVIDEESLEIVNKIAAVPTGVFGWYSDVPKETVMIERAYVIE